MSHHVRYSKIAGLLLALHQSRPDDTFEREPWSWPAPDLFLLDDSGLREFTVLQSRDFYDVTWSVTGAPPPPARATEPSMSGWRSSTIRCSPTAPPRIAPEAAPARGPTKNRCRGGIAWPA